VCMVYQHSRECWYTIHTLGLFRRRAEAVGNLDLSVTVLVAVHLDLLYQELHQLAALFERFASVLFARLWGAIAQHSAESKLKCLHICTNSPFRASCTGRLPYIPAPPRLPIK
jgi:hypothetical protein